MYPYLLLTARPTASPRESNPSSDTTLDNIPAPNSVHAPCWYLTLRRHLRRTLLHHEQHVVRQGLLHVWLPLPMLRYHDRHLRGRHYLARVFLALQRELSLAVAGFLYGWGERRVCVRERDFVLDKQIELWELYKWRALCGIQFVA